MPRSATPARLQSARRISLALADLYPDAYCALVHANPFQLLIATILSAQCTDKTVNKVTPGLFRRYPDAAAMANADLVELKAIIKPTGFYHNKAKNIIACAQTLMKEHHGKVPATLEALTQLPGVGRKTANVVLGDAFNIPGMVVDTHIGRLSRRLGLTKNTDAVKVEHDLMKLFPPEEWTKLGHRLIFHGRQVCDARKPRCGECTLKEFCPKVGVKLNTAQ
ncbi:MAG TPA: endonuclease III [Gemmatales bacterium]|nr:endonuclease III [Gemmatales bacterium]